MLLHQFPLRDPATCKGEDWRGSVRAPRHGSISARICLVFPSCAAIFLADTQDTDKGAKNVTAYRERTGGETKAAIPARSRDAILTFPGIGLNLADYLSFDAGCAEKSQALTLTRRQTTG